MKVKSITLENTRCYEGHNKITLSPAVNLLVGKNNSGKSTVLRALNLLQSQHIDYGFVRSLRRHHHPDLSPAVDVEFDRIDPRIRSFDVPNADEALLPVVHFGVGGDKEEVLFFPKSQDGSLLAGEMSPPISATEEESIFVPFFSRRRTQHLEQNTNLQATSAVVEDLRYLAAKVATVLHTPDDCRDEFERFCSEVLGFKVMLAPTEQGSEAALSLPGGGRVSINAMGEGVAHIIGFAAALCLSKGRIFLIEEIENDLHPEALRSVLELIARKSEANQFIISTHSNLAVRTLGSLPGTEIFAFRMSIESKTPTTSIERLPRTDIARARLLVELGYQAFDFGLWQAYLILEESSAETIINGVLIPHFAPRLAGRLRTISAGGNSNVEPYWTDFHRLFVYLNTSVIYPSASWLRIDGDAKGKEIVARLAAKFKKMPKGRIGYFAETAFERYFPARFRPEAERVLAIVDDRKRREAKREFNDKVQEWASSKPDLAKAEFAESAGEVIKLLRGIERSVCAKK